MSNTPQYSQTPVPSTSDVVRDTFLWRRKKLSLMVLTMATATWVVMEVYQFNFVTLASWASIFVVTSLFLWGTALRLLGKEEPELLSMEISERTAMETAKAVRAWAEEGIRWIFRVGAERDWFTFAGVVAGLWVLSEIGAYLDLLTLVYIAVVSGMTVPPLYVRHEDKITQLREKMKTRSRRLYERVDEKVVRNIKRRFQAKEETKEKKAE
ncbi:reticulon-like protein B13 [Rhodamnia argentea]|uniref:Reticulon-like protein n=1 Tax=Rhodamnia argentea TaxID=178133 RepID=A0ABM3GVF0_9MYRT|nr:reticulon-like protein B13 [Rhodamnia argentea]